MMEPQYKLERTKCPFYGFGRGLGSIFLDTQGNQCAHITGSHAPCRMEMSGQAPNWETCPMGSEELRREYLEQLIKSNARIFPREFCPEKETAWTGLSFAEWIRHISPELNIQYLPPEKK